MTNLSPTARLSLAYTAIIMAISAFFSLTLYNVATRSLEEGLHRQARIIFGQPALGRLQPPPELRQIESEQLADGQRRISFNLLETNLAILIFAGFGSYWLAQRTLKPIEEALESQSRFTADASHELRTPLTAMQTEIEVALRDKKLKLGEAKNLLLSNLEEVAKLRALSDGLLTLSRHQNGEQLQLSEVELAEVAAEAVKRLQPIIEKSQAKVGVEANSAAIRGDFESLVNLLVILIDNAIKYSQGVAEVKVAVSDDGRSALVKVIDSGVGIKSSDLSRIFDRFYRADHSRSKVTVGYGLGLSIAKQIVEMHGGTIEAMSAPSKGTEMRIKFPHKSPQKKSASLV